MIVYRATHLESGRVYIGITGQSLRVRINSHRSAKTKFGEFLRATSRDAFKWEILESCDSRDSLHAAEKRQIALHRSNEPEFGFNLTRGGAGVGGYVYSVESRERIRQAVLGRVKSNETRQKLSAANAGKRPSDACYEAWAKSEKVKEIHRKFGTPKGAKRPKSDAYRANASVARRAKVDAGLCCVLKKEYWAEIKRLREFGAPFKAIGEKFGVRAETVFYFVKRMS